MAFVRHWTGREARALRQALRMSTRDFAEKLGIGQRSVTLWESKWTATRLRPSSQALLDTVLAQAPESVHSLFTEILAETTPPRQHDHDSAARVRQTTVPMQASARTVNIDRHQEADFDMPDRIPPGDPVFNNRSDTESDDMQRRNVLLSAAALGLGTAAASAVGVETLRHELVSAALGSGPPSLNDWDEITWEYGRTYPVSTPAAMLESLTRDLSVLGQQLHRAGDEQMRRGLQRVTAQLSAYQAFTVGNLGDSQAARRWWRVARQTADASADTTVRVWVRGEEAVRGLYEQRPLPELIALADEALALSDTASVGRASAAAAKSQAYALLGYAPDAAAGLTLVHRIFEELPDSVTADTTSGNGFPEYCLRHTESFVYSHLGDVAHASTAQDQAIALYGDLMPRSRAMVTMHQALAMINSGDIDSGARHAQTVLTTLPAGLRGGPVTRLARTALRAIPASEAHRAAPTDLRRLLSA